MGAVKEAASVIGGTSVIEMSCTVTFTGYWSPVMRWNHGNESIRVINGTLTTDSISIDNLEDIQYDIGVNSTRLNNSLTLSSVLTVRRNVSSFSPNNHTYGNDQFQCVTFFTRNGKPTIQPLNLGYAEVYMLNNTPEYHRLCDVNVSWFSESTYSSQTGKCEIWPGSQMWKSKTIKQKLIFHVYCLKKCVRLTYKVYSSDPPKSPIPEKFLPTPLCVPYIVYTIFIILVQLGFIYINQKFHNLRIL